MSECNIYWPRPLNICICLTNTWRLLHLNQHIGVLLVVAPLVAGRIDAPGHVSPQLLLVRLVHSRPRPGYRHVVVRRVVAVLPHQALRLLAQLLLPTLLVLKLNWSSFKARSSDDLKLMGRSTTEQALALRRTENMQTNIRAALTRTEIMLCALSRLPIPSLCAVAPRRPPARSGRRILRTSA